MRRPLLALIAFFVCAATAAGAQTPRERLRERLAARAAQESQPIDVPSILPGARKQTLAYGDDPAHALDVYLPPNAHGAPIIVMVHGGAWMIGDKANFSSVSNKLKAWLPQGYIFVSVNYRLVPKTDAYGQVEDLAAALRYVQDHAGAWGGDADRLILMGHSAGAHLAAVVSADPTLVGRPWAGTVVLDSAALDVPKIMGRVRPSFYDWAFGTDAARWPQVSPADRWSVSSVPMMLVCSTLRPDQPCREARAFAETAQRSGVAIPVLPVALPHAGVNFTLGLRNDYTRQVEAFIAARLAAPLATTAG